MPTLETLFSRANIAFQKGNGAEAEKLYRKLKKQAPGEPAIHHLGAMIAHSRAQWGPALERLMTLHKISTPTKPSLMLLAHTQRKLGKTDAAIAVYRDLIRQGGKDAGLFLNLGNALAEQGDNVGAVEAYDAALRNGEPDADALYNRSLAQRRLGDDEQALDDLRQAFHLQPAALDIGATLASVLNDTGQAAEARELLNDLLRRAPDNAMLWNNLGNSLRLLAAYEASLEAFSKAAALNPQDEVIKRNLGNAFLRVGQTTMAEPIFQGLAKQNQKDLDAQMTYGALLISTKRDAEGWRYLERRWHPEAPGNPGYALPWWAGEPLAGKRILVWGDQGVGDEIMFSQCLTDLEATGARTTLVCDPRLQALFQDAYRNIDVIARGTSDTADKAFDCQSALSSLPRWLYPMLAETPPRPKAYLRADPAYTKVLRERYLKQCSKTQTKLVGIAWRSGNATRPERNIELEAWAPVLSNPHALFINLQYGDVAAEVADVSDLIGCRILIDDEIDQFKSISDFAAQISALDQVVTISNATLHTAGALGLPVLGLIPQHIDWRYGIDRVDTPWYPTVQLLRQTGMADWSGAINQAAELI